MLISSTGVAPNLLQFEREEVREECTADSECLQWIKIDNDNGFVVPDEDFIVRHQIIFMKCIYTIRVRESWMSLVQKMSKCASITDNARFLLLSSYHALDVVGMAAAAALEPDAEPPPPAESCTRFPSLSLTRVLPLAYRVSCRPSLKSVFTVPSGYSLR